MQLDLLTSESTAFRHRSLCHAGILIVLVLVS